MKDIYSKLDSLIEKIKPYVENSPEIEGLFQSITEDVMEFTNKIQILTRLGVDLNKEKDNNRVLQMILEGARELTNADAGTVYLIREDYVDDVFKPGEIQGRYLDFKILQNETMSTYLGGSGGEIAFLPPVSLEKNGLPNNSNVSAFCANTGEIINLPDVYHAEGFDFSGTKKYDQQTGYNSKSMLVIPLRNHENEIIGVLQLINRRNQSGETIAFDEHDEEQVEAVSYQAAVAITNQRLLNEQVNLFDAFLKMIAEGLGEKSPYTYNHIERVAIFTNEIARAVGEYEEGMYKTVSFTETQMDELNLTGWMHDIGKMTTPEHVVSKQIKLQVIGDRMETMAERYNSKIKDIEIAYLKKKLKGIEEDCPKSWFRDLNKKKKKEIEVLAADLKILHATNTGGEFLEQERRDLILRNADKTVIDYLDVQMETVGGEDRVGKLDLAKRKRAKPLINEFEKKCLLISRGTLTEEERQIINDHAERSWRWLSELPFPKKYLKLPLYAGAHHETLNGTGYPNKMVAKQLPIQARIIAIADIFEALVASDRPYKKPMLISKALQILGFMTKDNHLDAEVMKILLESGTYLELAREHCKPDQIDEVDVKKWLEKFYPRDFQNTLPEFDNPHHEWVVGSEGANPKPDSSNSSAAEAT